MRPTYRQWLDELWNGELDRLEQLAGNVVTDDFIGNWPTRPGLVHGPHELAAVIHQGRILFDELRFHLELGPIADGDLVAARWVGRGRRGADSIEFRGHDMLRIDGDRFGEYWVISEEPRTTP